MARSDFDNAGEYVKVTDFEGELILFTPTQYVDEVETTFGTKDAVITDIAVLSADGNTEHDDVMVFQGSLIAALKRRIKVNKTIERDPASGVVSEYETTTTRRVLGVLGKGEAKKGQNAPYVLEPASEAQVALAAAYHAANPVPEFPRALVNQYVDSGNAAPFQAPAHTVNVAAPTPAATPAAPVTVPDSEDPFAVPAGQ